MFNPKYIHKFKIIPQGFKNLNKVKGLYNGNKILTFALGGTIMPRFRDPFSLIDFLIEKQVEFKFIIYSKNNKGFEKYKDRLGLSIELREPLNREEFIQEIAKADILVNVNTNSNNGVINAIPTKLIDYMVSDRPILPYEQSFLPTNIVEQFIAGNYENAYIIKDFEKYKIENVAANFIHLLNR